MADYYILDRENLKLFLPFLPPALRHGAEQGTFLVAGAVEDELAVGAVKYAVAGNRKIPEEFQITGYNNSVLSTCSTPELTTMDNRVEFLCVTAVEQMMQVLEKKDVAEHTMFSGRIIERETTKP